MGSFFGGQFNQRKKEHMGKKKQTSAAVSYGMVATAEQINKFLDINFELNNAARKDHRPGRVPFIWGPKGIGKTETVRGWAESRGYEFVEIPLAQFEEMGDINGFPVLSHEKDAEGNVVEKTICAPPEWVPNHSPKKGGILFFDDANRAEPRIQRGLMQLYQTYGMVSWKIPEKWMIVCTGNPEDGDYDVSSMDEAQITRLNHIQMKFDHKVWARWAEHNSIHPEGIKFVLRYPEMASDGQHERTCPRTLVEFFRSLEHIGKNSKELKDNIDLVAMMGNASLDEEAVTTFMTFLSNDAHLALDPDVILSDPDKTRKHLKNLHEMKPKRTDIMSIMTIRLTNTILPTEFKINKDKGAALLSYLRSSLDKDGLPKELAYMLIRDINNGNNQKLIELWSKDPKLVKMVADATNTSV